MAIQLQLSQTLLVLSHTECYFCNLPVREAATFKII